MRVCHVHTVHMVVSQETKHLRKQNGMMVLNAPGCSSQNNTSQLQG
jgi:hypothetical protein